MHLAFLSRLGCFYVMYGARTTFTTLMQQQFCETHKSPTLRKASPLAIELLPLSRGFTESKACISVPWSSSILMVRI